MTAGYLGPRGTFTEEAALKLFEQEQIKPYHTIFEVLCDVESGKLDYGIVPVENSTEGTVNATVDALIFDMNLYIQKLIILPIEQNLAAKENTKIEDITHIYSHSHAIAQCKRYLYDNFNDISASAADSTAAAAKLVAETEGNNAAFATDGPASINGLKILEKGIQDSNVNFTEFALVGKKNTSKIVAGNKTSICFSTLDEPGSLYKLLDIFSIWDVNMSRIISRPMRNHPNEYVFFIDLQKNENEQDLVDALKMIERKTSFFKILGSYPVFDYRE